MFTVFCPRHRANVLLSQDAIVGLRGDDNGYEVQWRCHCGETGATLIGLRELAAG